MRSAFHFLVILMGGALGCSSTPAIDVDHKLDSRLVAAIDQAAESGSAEMQRFAVLLRTRAEPDREELEAAGLTIETIAGRVITATGTAIALREAAALESVETITLSQTVDYPLPDDV